jgi:predicted AAA+ superfamily ATPase
MTSLDLKEFMLAIGEKNAELENIIQATEFEPFLFHHYQDVIKKYMIIGGMPESINTYLNTNNFNEVYKTKKNILREINDDITKYAPVNMRAKIMQCLDSVPIQLSKPHTKFQYAKIDKAAARRDYEKSLN